MRDSGGRAPGGGGWGTDAQVQVLLDGYGMVLSGPLGSGVGEAFAAVLGALRARGGLAIEVAGSLAGRGIPPADPPGAAEHRDVLAVPDCERLDAAGAARVADAVRSGGLKVLIACNYAHHRSVSTSNLCQLLPFVRLEPPPLSPAEATGIVEQATGAPPSAAASGILGHAAGGRRALHGVLVRDALDAGLLAVRGGAAVLLGSPAPGPGLLRLLQDWKSSLTPAEERAFDVVCLARRVWVPDLVALTGDRAVDGLLARGLLARAGLGVHRVEPATRVVGTAGRQLLGMARRRELAAEARTAGLPLDPVSEALWMAGTATPPTTDQLVAAASRAMGLGRAADAVELLAGVGDPCSPTVRVLDAAVRTMLGGTPGAQETAEFDRGNHGADPHAATPPAGIFHAAGDGAPPSPLDSARRYLHVQHLLRAGDYPAARKLVEDSRKDKAPAWVWHRASLETSAAAGAPAAARALATERAVQDAGGPADFDPVFLAIMSGELDGAVEATLRPAAAGRDGGTARSAAFVGLAAVLVLTGSHREGLRILRAELAQAEAWDATGTGYAAHAMACYAAALEGKVAHANSLLVHAATHHSGGGPLGSAWLGTAAASLARLRLAGREHRPERLELERGSARDAGDRTRALLLGTRSLAAGVDGAAGGVLEDAGRVEGRFASVSADIAAGVVGGKPQRLVDASEVLLDMGQYALVRATAHRIRRHDGRHRVPGRLIGEADRRARALSERIEAALGTLLPPQGNGTTAADAHAASGPALTPRQRDIVALVGLGMDNSQIAGQLGLAVRTVESHLHSIYSKGAAPRLRQRVRPRQSGEPGT